MEQRINIAELLKDCPSGMELDCTICENVYFDEVTPYMIRCYIKNDAAYNSICFHHDGSYLTCDKAKCVIFPKGRTTWEGFQRPFKDGDIVFSGVDLISIYKEEIREKFAIPRLHSYVSLSNSCMFKIDKDNWTLEGIRFATEEEKQKLFKAIEDNGYKWNEETKTLEELPKFKDGDVIANNTYIVIFHKLDKIPNGTRNDVVYYHCWHRKKSGDSKFKIDFGIGYESDFRFATDEEKQKLFDAIKDNGYKWVEETKTLEKLIIPKFKVGDKVVKKDDPTEC